MPPIGLRPRRYGRQFKADVGAGPLNATDAVLAASCSNLLDQCAYRCVTYGCSWAPAVSNSEGPSNPRDP